MSIQVWAKSDNGDIGPCLTCSHEYGAHFTRCRFHPSNLARVRYYSDKAYILYLNHHVLEDGRVSLSQSLNLKYAFAYEGNLTDKKRLLWGATAFDKFMEKIERPENIKMWNEAPESERLRWLNTHGGRYDKVTVTVDFTYKDITFDHDRGSMTSPIGQVWHDNFKLKEGS